MRGPAVVQHAAMATRPSPANPRIGLPWQASFLICALAWGCSFWFMKVGLRALSPVQVAFWRLALGAVALLLLAAATRTRLPRRLATWRRLTVVAVLWNSVPFMLFAYGETHVSSVLAGIINAATPLSTLAVVLLAYPEERPTPQRIAGLLIGFAGVLVVIGVWTGLGRGEWIGIAACVGAITCYGIAFPYARRHISSGEDGPLSLGTAQVLVGALLLVPVAGAQGGFHGPLTGSVVAAMLALGVVGTGIAFALNFQVVEEAGATTASTVTYLTPLVAVVVGAAFLDEGVAWYEPVGALVVLAGVAVSQGRLRLPRPRRLR